MRYSLAAPLSARLATLGLAEDAVLHSQIRTSGNTPMHWTDEGAPFAIHKLKTPDLDQLASWIGNDDELYHQNVLNASHFKTPERLDDVASHIAAAKSYIFGNSQRVRQHKEAIERKLGPFEVHVSTAEEIVIEPGAPLIISGNDPKVLVADRLIFMSPEAKLINVGVLTINVKTIIVKPA